MKARLFILHQTASVMLAFSLSLLAIFLPGEASGSTGTIPANIGVGPAANMVFGPVFEDRPIHPALKIWTGAVLDRETIRANMDRVPPSYRKRAASLDEVRIGAHILIPDSIIVSPKLNNTGLIGATWRPLSLSVPIIKSERVRTSLSTGAILTYAYLWSDTVIDGGMHFLRPGLDLKAEAEFRVTQRVFLSLGWASLFHLPQELGKNPFSFDQALLEEAPSSLRRTIWHIGQPFLMLHYRFPYRLSGRRS